MTERGDQVAPFLDLVTAPFTLPGSRLLVLKSGGGLTVRSAEYELSLDECPVVEALRVLDGAGRPVPVSRVLPDRIELGWVTVCFDGERAVSIGSVGGEPWRLEVRLSSVGERGVWDIGLPSSRSGAWLAAGDETFVVEGSGLTWTFGSAPGAVRLSVGDSGVVDHAGALRRSATVWDEWFDRCPTVADHLQAMTAFCWWVLGANTVTLPARGGARAVVPSKIGYVGLWQWDAYFIAAGLRHGAPELAREQLDLALRFAGADGQLPDVVHEEGVLSSSDDLPPGDRENLRRAGSSIADPDAAIPLTKPPLAAWALARVAEVVHDDTWLQWAWGVVGRSQDWWFDQSDLDGDGLPEYGHPYSSGLDDSPVFDAELPVLSPDLATYLIVQDELLGGWHAARGAPAEARRCRQRADATLDHLLRMWDDELGRFRAAAGGHPLAAYTVVSLLPFLTGRLPEPVLAAMLRDLDDPSLFGAPFPVPTVALGDPTFAQERMWRGPTWVNTNALIVEGLEASGQPDRARELALRTLDLVLTGGGPHEYFDPMTGRRTGRATSAFGWSAALFVDLAVRYGR